MISFKNLRPLASSFLLLTALLSLQACEAPKEESELDGPVRISWPTTDREGLIDAALPPFELKDKSFAGSGRFNSVFWLDFEGATVSSKDSFIVGNAGLNQVVIPPFASSDIGSSEDREKLKLNLVQNLVTLFPDVDIKLTTTEPLTPNYSRVHIGGRNFTGKPRVLGIAPLDLGNRVPNDILFIYTQDMKSLGDVATVQTELTHVIAHEIAHALGARHINNEFGLMKPSVALEADSFNLSGPVVGSPNEIENSLQILLNSSGSRNAAFADRGLPDIQDLGAFATEGVIQYTVMSKNNFAANLGLSLADYTYQWNFEGKQTEGTSVLLSFIDNNEHILNLTVIGERGASRKFQFSVGHRR